MNTYLTVVYQTFASVLLNTMLRRSSYLAVWERRNHYRKQNHQLFTLPLPEGAPIRNGGFG